MSKDEEELLQRQELALTKMATASKLMSEDFVKIMLLVKEPQSYMRDKEVLRLLERANNTINFIQNTLIEDLFEEDLTPIRD
jgi:hypothetical protein